MAAQISGQSSFRWAWHFHPVRSVTTRCQRQLKSSLPFPASAQPSLQTKLQSNPTAQDGIRHYRPGSSEEK
jgi:hypothetical protein